MTRRLDKTERGARSTTEEPVTSDFIGMTTTTFDRVGDPTSTTSTPISTTPTSTPISTTNNEIQKEKPVQVKEDHEEEDSDDESIIHVDFDFYAPKDIDYHACKRFLVHLFGLDAEHLHTELMVETLLKQTQLGTTVKVDGEESDPFALLTLLPLPTTTPWASTFLEWIQNQVSSPALKTEVQTHLHHLRRVGWLINERLVNMPPQIAPALFRLLLEEHQSAQDPAFQFDTIVYVTKVYHEVPAQESSETKTTTKKDRPRKKVKKSALSEFYFNVEDQVLQQFAFMSFDFKPKMTKEGRVPEAARVFQDCGIDVFRRVFILDGRKLVAMRNAVASFLSEGGADPE